MGERGAVGSDAVCVSRMLRAELQMGLHGEEKRNPQQRSTQKAALKEENLKKSHLALTFWQCFQVLNRFCSWKPSGYAGVIHADCFKGRFYLCAALILLHGQLQQCHKPLDLKPLRPLTASVSSRRLTQGPQQTWVLGLC